MAKSIQGMVASAISRKEQAMRNKASRAIKKHAKKMGVYDNTIVSVTVDGEVIEKNIMAMSDPVGYLRKLGIIDEN